jgi:hypothetical protein
VSTLKVNNVEDLGADPVVTNGVIEKAALPSGSILQVVSTTKTDTFTTSNTAYTDVTGLSVSITPSSATSKILVSASMVGCQTVGSNGFLARLLRDSTAIAIGDTAGSRDRASITTMANDGNWPEVANVTHLDSPSSTSALTYKIQVRATGANPIFVNRGQGDSDTGTIGRFVSSITLIEVAG